MTTYILQGMSHEDYSNYMLGSYNYHISQITVTANSKEEALQQAKTTGLVINENYILTLEEYEAEIEKQKKKDKEFRRKIEEEKQRKQDKKLQKQTTKAKELGLSLEAYQQYEKLEASIKRAEKRKADYYATIQSATKGITYENNLIEKNSTKWHKYLIKNN